MNRQYVYAIVDGNYFNSGNNNLGGSLVNYSSFDENEDLSNKNKFELLSQVEGAMNDYYTKMKKVKEDKKVTDHSSKKAGTFFDTLITRAKDWMSDDIE